MSALDVGFMFAERDMNWSVKTRVDMYLLAEKAFGATPDLESFRFLYKWLVSYWGISRNGVMASASDTFTMLVEGCEAVGRDSGVTLLNMDKDAVLSAVRSLERVKIVGEYPHMAASKFLHFYNPTLFPIYDNAVVWNMILNGIFRSEWQLVCREYGIKFRETSENFLTTYYLMAAELMLSADDVVMTEFVTRFRAQGGEGVNLLSDTEQYYATAFDYILMGAAKLESD